MSDAKGKYKDETTYIWQIKHESNYYYRDNLDSTMFDDGLEGLKRCIKGQDTDNLKTRLIKRTVKEDIIKRHESR